MDTIVALNLFGYALALAGGVALGTMFGRVGLKELSGLVHGFETRLSSLEGALGLRSAGAAAVEHHAAATEKLAEAVRMHAESQNRPQAAAH